MVTEGECNTKREKCREQVLQIACGKTERAVSRLLWWLAGIGALLLVIAGGMVTWVKADITRAEAETQRVEQQQRAFEGETRTKLDRLLESNARIEEKLHAQKAERKEP